MKILREIVTEAGLTWIPPPATYPRETENGKEEEVGCNLYAPCFWASEINLRGETYLH